MTPKGVRTRLALLNAATAAFAEQGFDRVSMNEIADLAGVTAGSVYRYFEDKLELYQAASVHAVSRTTARILTSVAEAIGPEAQLRVFIETLAEVILGDEQNTKLFERHLISNEMEVLSQAVHAAFEKPFALLIDLLNMVCRQPKSKKDAAAIFGLTLGTAQFSTLLDMSATSQIGLHRSSRDLAEFVINTLVPELSAPDN